MKQRTLLSIVIVCFTILFTTFVNCKSTPSNLRLIELGKNEKPVWLDQEQILTLIQKRIGFMDVTDYDDLSWAAEDDDSRGPPLPNQPQQKRLVRSYNSKLSTSNIRTNVQTLSSYETRYYKSKSGEEAANWIKDTLVAYAKGREDVTVSLVPHPNNGWLQPSVIARIEGNVTKEEAVIVGAHEDSVNQSGVNKSAPGVDDDGSGTTCNLEVFRVLMDNNFIPNRTVEFHFYAAEEAGLLGSSQIAKKYEEEKRVVVGMLQLDMVFFVGKNPPIIAINTNLVSKSLAEFTRQLAVAYSDIPWKNTFCGYACSDFASWTRAGYRSTFPFESRFLQSNPHVHTVKDTLEYANLDHGLEFAKVALGFAVELAATEYEPLSDNKF